MNERLHSALKVILPVSGIALSCAFATILVGFGMIAEPDSSWVVTFLFGLAGGLLFNAGLLLAPLAMGRPLWKRMTVALMLSPCSVLLVVSATDAVRRFAQGRPMPGSTHALYAIGLALYATAWWTLFSSPDVPRESVNGRGHG